MNPTDRFLQAIRQALGDAPAPATLTVTGVGSLPSVFAVSDLATASIAAAALAVADLIACRGASPPAVTVDRRLASVWFASSLRPQGWSVPPAWDAIAGDYATVDGWIRLHTNAPHHRAAALDVLGVPAQKDLVRQAVAHWQADALEAAVVTQGGCAAAMRGQTAWAAHAQGQAVAGEPLLHDAGIGSGPRPDWAVPPERPLAGIRVLDLTRVLAGPIGTRFLAGYGAEVLRIDPPWWDEAAIVPEVTLGKRCARLDLRQPADLAVLRGLLAQADVLVHGYRPHALARLGLGAVERRALNPGLVDVCLNAYGWTGPWQGRRGFDSLVQMSSGIADAGMRRLGRDCPTPLPVQALDHATGYLLAAAAVRGLQRRLTTGAGSEMRTSLARMAQLLVTDDGAAPEQPGLAAETADDLGPSEEATLWGVAHRLRPPAAIGNAPMRWDRPAAPLGSSAAAW